MIAHRVLEAIASGSTVVVGDSPHRSGRAKFLEVLNKKLEEKWMVGGKRREEFKSVEFVWVEGTAVQQGYRDELISTSARNEGQEKASTLPIGLLLL